VSALLDKIVSRSSAGSFRRLEVPEWGDDGAPLIIKYSMVTMGELEQVRRSFPDNPLRQNVEIICMKALDESGKPMFDRYDAVTLMQTVDAALLLRIATQMMTVPSGAAAAKN
jgi:hypothetical protein